MTIAWQCVVFFVVLALSAMTAPSRADDLLLEIDVNDGGDILGVRDGEGNSLVQIPFEQIGEVDLIRTESLLLGEVSGLTARCCKRRGKWYSCADVGFDGLSSTLLIDEMGQIARIDGLVDGTWQTDLQPHDPPGTQAPIEEATIVALKSHTVAVAKVDNVLYGLVFAAGSNEDPGQSIWYDPEMLK
jgi:hypothetical protein